MSEYNMFNSKKIIVENRSNLDMIEALLYVQSVIEGGRISNQYKQFCYATRFESCVIYTDLNKKSDRFVIVNPPYPD